eukprot:11273930-Ditylum_brightwellii.AAC.1
MDYNDFYTEHVCQGSDNQHDNWCIARFNFAEQMLIRMGLLDPTKNPDPPLPKAKAKKRTPPENAELASPLQQDVLMSRDNENEEPEV